MNSVLLILLSNGSTPRLSHAINTVEVIDEEMANAQDIPDLINRFEADKSPRLDGNHPRVLKMLSVHVGDNSLGH